MHEAAERIAAEVALRPDAALDALRWHWGDAYNIGRNNDAWWFQRRDGLGGMETASGPDALRTVIIENYITRPVRRETAADVEDRRDRYEAAGVRIWHDPGGWHARWPLNGTHTGISHPDHLTGLLDRLDALKDSPGADTVSPLLPDWDGAAATGGLLPPWAQELIRSCRHYTFTSTHVYQGRSVLARRISGTGPDVVITRDEDEMRTALGLKPRAPVPS